MWKWDERVSRGLTPALALGCLLASITSAAEAQVFQTDAVRTALPQPVGLSELGLGSVWGYDTATMSYHDPSGALLATPIVYGEYYAPPAYPQFVNGDAFTLQGLFKWRKEGIDPITDAATGPGHFFPGCGFKAELVLRGGDCDAVLGWYNFKGSSTPPGDADIQPLVPESSTYLFGTRTEFVPLGWDNRDPRDLSRLAWTPQAFSSGDIRANSHYAGGDVAFALLRVPGAACTANKFSVYEHNAKNASGVPWVTSLIYRSAADPTAIYLAFEDMPMLPADWRQTGSQYTNDGDFNDSVFFISGLGATEECPDPACANIVCGPDMTCSGGTCVPAGSVPGGGAGAGGSGGGAGAGGSGGGSDLGNDLGGAPTGGQPSDATTAGAASANNAGGAPDAPGDGLAGAPDTATAGAPSSEGHGGGGATSRGCSCHLGNTHRQTLTSWLSLALVAAGALRRRRRP